MNTRLDWTDRLWAIRNRYTEFKKQQLTLNDKQIDFLDKAEHFVKTAWNSPLDISPGSFNMLLLNAEVLLDVVHALATKDEAIAPLEMAISLNTKEEVLGVPNAQ